MLIAVTACTFFLIVIIMWQLYLWFGRKDRMIAQRFGRVVGKREKEQVTSPKVKLKRAGLLLEKMSLFGGLLGRNYLEKQRINLTKAGVPLKPEEFAAINFFTGIAGFGLGMLLFRGLVLALVLSVLGFIAPGLWLGHLHQRRLVIMEGQLLDAVLLLANSLRAGHSFLQALELVSRETPLPLSGEFNRTVRETRLGVTLEEALINLNRRVESREMEMLVTGVLIQREVGGNLAEILDQIGGTIEKRIKMRAKIRALTAQQRLSAWVVTLLPFCLGAFIFTQNPEFARIMLEDPLGIAMLAGGAVMLVIGVLIIRKVVDIDV